MKITARKHIPFFLFSLQLNPLCSFANIPCNSHAHTRLSKIIVIVSYSNYPLVKYLTNRKLTIIVIIITIKCFYLNNLKNFIYKITLIIPKIK